MLKRSKFVRFILIFIAGCLAGYLLLPSKTIVKVSEEDKKTIAELKSKLQSLETVNRKLKTRERTVIIETPDGTKTTKIVKVSEEFETKLKEVKQELEEKKKELAKLKQKEKIEINKRSFGVGIGIDTNRQIYGRMSYDVLPFLFVGANASLNRIGVDVGFRL